MRSSQRGLLQRREHLGNDDQIAVGELTLRLPLADIVAQQQANGLRVLSISIQHTLALDRLPSHHKDPFDRLLIAQAIVENSELVTSDQWIRQYPVRILW